ncbi:MAG: RsmB/NOP family class I SAM-dependent RNA methyltransferase [Rhizomicrobium sp.]|jgi:16S rRNA (cytosine967-C5)-methyltransferase
MTPSARLQAAIDILTELERSNAPADRFMREWFRHRRYAGSKDRAAIGERVFAVFRHRESFAWRMHDTSPRSLVIASVLAEGSSAVYGRGGPPQAVEGAAALETLFFGGYGPAPLSDDERTVIASPPNEAPPLHVRGEFPEWLDPELKRSLGDNLLIEMRALCERARVDLRVNTLRATREDLMRELTDAGYSAERTLFSPVGIRIGRDGKLSALSRSPAFEDGRFEFQDEAAQIASILCAAKPGERILDVAAGAGGKSLALAARMDNRGEILAFDDIAERLKPLPERAARAGASCIAIARTRGGPAWGNGKFDAVFVDAPCSGTGTWRRQPELRWRITPESVAAVQKTQSWLLDDAARHTRPGGRIVYATCSILKCENEDQIDAFLARHPEYRVLPASGIWRAETGAEPPTGMGDTFNATPLRTGTDGFFTAVMVHSR